MDLRLLMDRISSDFNALQKHINSQEVSNRTNEDTMRQLQEELWFCQNSHYAKSVIKENMRLKLEVETLTARLKVSQDIIKSMREVVESIRSDVKMHFVNDHIIEMNNQGMSAFRIATIIGVTKAMVNEVLKKGRTKQEKPMECNEIGGGQKNIAREATYTALKGTISNFLGQTRDSSRAYWALC